jgi:hypothetical protein
MKNAWNWIGRSILQYKFPLLGFILLLTIGLAFKASQIQLSYELAKILPASDERFQLYEGFKKKYGEDGAVMVIAVENPQIFSPAEFQAWRNLSNEVKKQAFRPLMPDVRFLKHNHLPDLNQITSKTAGVILETIQAEPMARIDYVELVDARTLQQVDSIERPVLVALAVYIGKTRLIDNFITE